MARETTYAGKLGEWQRLLEPIAANAAELAHLDVPRSKLAAFVAQVVMAGREQAAREAARQEQSQRIKEAIVEGDRLATLLRSAIKEHYGIRAVKLAEFGLQPFRGRPRNQPPAESVPLEVVRKSQDHPAEPAEPSAR